MSGSALACAQIVGVPDWRADIDAAGSGGVSGASSGQEPDAGMPPASTTGAGGSALPVPSCFPIDSFTIAMPLIWSTESNVMISQDGTLLFHFTAAGDATYTASNLVLASCAVFFQIVSAPPEIVPGIELKVQSSNTTAEVLLDSGQMYLKDGSTIVQQGLFSADQDRWFWIAEQNGNVTYAAGPELGVPDIQYVMGGDLQAATLTLQVYSGTPGDISLDDFTHP